MNPLYRPALFLLAVFAALAFPSAETAAQLYKDTVYVVQSPGSRPYQCCYTFVVASRQRRGSTIAELNVRIVSGRGQFLSSQASSPTDWTVFPSQDLQSVSWFATTTAAEIDSGENVTGFVICAADTGVVRMVWETRSLDTVFSTDTMVVACRGIECDEAFFRQVPSNQACVFEGDIVGGNRRGVPINELRLRMLTDGVDFITTMTGQPAGWTRNRNTSDSIGFVTFTNTLDFGEILEGFRFQVNAQRDSTFRILWTMRSYDENVCADTATLVCRGLTAGDSVSITSSPDSCCDDLGLVNAHTPSSTITRFAVKVLTPNVLISTLPLAPSGWTRTVSPNSDSVSYSSGTGLSSGDTLGLGAFCFDNSAAASDLVRYRWQTFGGGITIDAGESSRLCLRPLTRCDSVTARVDSSEGATSRCIALVLRNQNSRNAEISRIVIRISNPGVRRRILSASAAPGWSVGSASGDSVVFSGATLAPGDSDLFSICVSIDDPGMLDPLTISWRTDDTLGPICSGSLNVNATIVILCDTLLTDEQSSFEPTWCCYSVAFVNANSKGTTLNGFQLEVGSTTIAFGDARGAGTWWVADSTFPAVRIGFTGGTVAPGDTSPRLTFCIDARQLPERPVALPIIWRSFGGGNVICSGTIQLQCVGQPGADCDTAILISVGRPEEACSYEFGVANLHMPASTVNQVRFRIMEGEGRFTRGYTTGAAIGFNQVTVRPDTVIFVGDSIMSRDTVGSFIVEIGQTESAAVDFEVCTYNGEQAICCDIVEATCGTTGIVLPIRTTGFRIVGASPTPSGSLTTVGFQVVRPGEAAYVLRDPAGAELSRRALGTLGVGEHHITLDVSSLASGVYYLTLDVGSERATQRIVVVR